MVARKSKSHKSSSSISSGDSPPSRDTGSASPPLHSPGDNKMGSPYQEVHPMLLQYLQGATFHSPPHKAASIPSNNNGTQTQTNVSQSMAVPNAAEGPGSDGSAVYCTRSDGKAGVGPSLSYMSSALSTPSTAGLLTPDGSRSNSFSGFHMMGDEIDGAIWQGKVEPISLSLSDNTHYLDWLSSTSSSPFQSPDQLQRMETSFPDPALISPQSSAFGAPAGMGQQMQLGAQHSSSVQLPPSANTLDIFGVTPGTGFLNGYGSPSGTMVELGVSSEGGMDARWMTFVHDCGIMENSNAMQQNG